MNSRHIIQSISFVSPNQSVPVTQDPESPRREFPLLRLPVELQDHIASYLEIVQDRVNYELSHKLARQIALNQNRSISFEFGVSDKVVTNPEFCTDFEMNLERWSKVHTMYITLDVFEECFAEEGKLEKLTSLRKLTVHDSREIWHPIVWTEPWYLRLVSYMKNDNPNLRTDLYDRGKSSFLQHAIDNLQAKCIDFWVERSLDLNSKDYNGFTLLRRALSYGDFYISEKLIDAGVDVDIQDNDGDTALMIASSFRYSRIAEKLIQANADLDIQNEKGSTALMNASWFGHSGIVELLIQFGANVNIQDEYGCTALMLAAELGYPHIVEQLIQNGADVNIRNSNGLTAMSIASWFDQPEIVTLLSNVETTATARRILNEV